MRLHELAKELGANSKDLLKIAKEMGMAVKSHSSTLAPGQISLLKAAFLYADDDEDELLRKIEEQAEERRRVEEEEKEVQKQKALERRKEVEAGVVDAPEAEAEPVDSVSDEELVAAKLLEGLGISEDDSAQDSAETNPQGSPVLDDPAVVEAGTGLEDAAAMPEVTVASAEAPAVAEDALAESLVAESASPVAPVEEHAVAAASDASGDPATKETTAQPLETTAASSMAPSPVRDPASKDAVAPAAASVKETVTPTETTSEPSSTEKVPAAAGTPTAKAPKTGPASKPPGSKPPAGKPEEKRRGARILGRIELPGMNKGSASSSGETSAPSRGGGPGSDTHGPGRSGGGGGDDRSGGGGGGGGGDRARRGRGKPSSGAGNNRRWQSRPDEFDSSGGAGGGRPKFWERGPARRPHQGGGGRRGRGRAAKPQKAPTLPQKSITVSPPISVKDLSQLLGIKTSDILVKFLMKGKQGININSVLDEEGILMVAAEFKREVDVVEKKDIEDAFLEEHELETQPVGDASVRAPVVTFLGHVDHGKTSLLDRIRSTDVASGEAGGITQHVRAYRVTASNGQSIAFLDTPGHRAFTEMRLRGAKMTDVAVLVVAADDGVMPQTEEAYQHLRAADSQMPIVVALNKIDKADANPMRAKQQLANMGLLPEEFGGDVGVVEVSAITGDGIDDLLERISLEAEIRELDAHPDRPAMGTVVDARKDDEIGVAVTVLVQDGTLRIRDNFLCGQSHGKVRALFDHRGKPLDSAGPSEPAVVVGFDEVPKAGDQFMVVENAKKAREVVEQRRERARQESLQERQTVTLDNLSAILSEAGSVEEIKIILKADVQGTLEVVRRELNDLKHSEVKIKIIRDALGGVSEDDVLLALASEAIVIGFNVVADEKARVLSDSRSVEIRTYQVIYELIDDIKKAMEGALKPIQKEKVCGHAEIRQVFKISRFGNIAGCMVTDGSITRANKVRLVRNGTILYTGSLDSLKRVKDDAREVKEGFECGIKIAGYNDIKVGDVIESFEMIEEKRVLALES